MKKTLVIGASTNPERYAYQAAEKLTQSGHPIVLFGLKKGVVFGEEIISDWQAFTEIDTVTLYIGPKNQAGYFERLKAIRPKRVIFNPGTENLELQQKLAAEGIQVEEACTLVLLSLKAY